MRVMGLVESGPRLQLGELKQRADWRVAVEGVGPAWLRYGLTRPQISMIGRGNMLSTSEAWATFTPWENDS
jgi:hypothetical protein